MRIGYNTNGFSHHRLEDALAILSELGYQAVAITLDHSTLNPFDRQIVREAEKVRRLLTKYQLDCVLETNSRYLLDPWRKYQPTLVSARPRERDRRIELLSRAVRLAAVLEASFVSFQSGAPLDGAPQSLLQERFVESLRPVLDAAVEAKVSVSIEPVPGMVIDSFESALRLQDRMATRRLSINVDLANLQAQFPSEWDRVLRGIGPRLGVVHIADTRPGEVKRLTLGQGTLDCAGMLKTLQQIGYQNGIYVELPDLAGDAVETARTCLGYLRSCLGKVTDGPAAAGPA